MNPDLFKTWNFFTFSYFNGQLCPTGSGFRIRIRIHKPNWIRIQYTSRSGSTALVALLRTTVKLDKRKFHKYFTMFHRQGSRLKKPIGRIRNQKNHPAGSGSEMTLQVKSESEINSYGSAILQRSIWFFQGCETETINFRSGSYLKGHFGSGSWPQVFTDPDPAHGSFLIRILVCKTS